MQNAEKSEQCEHLEGNIDIQPKPIRSCGHIYSSLNILMLILEFHLQYLDVAFRVTSLSPYIFFEERKVTLLKFRRKHNTLIGWSPPEQQLIGFVIQNNLGSIFIVDSLPNAY